MLAVSAAALLAACSNDPPVRTVGGVSRSVFSEDDYGVSTSPRVATDDVPKGGGTFKLGEPYKVAGRWYVPRENPNYDETGVASWYGADFHGRRTANGEVFDANALTAAHPTLPLPCYAEVTNLDNGRTVLVRVNDRGPYVNDRVIDMSYASAKALGYTSQGRARVRVRYAGRAPLNGDDSRERQYLAEQQSRPNEGPPIMLASARTTDAPAPYTSTYDRSSLPADASDRWSPTTYRASLAGKPQPPLPAPAARSRTYIQTARTSETPDRYATSRMPGGESLGTTRMALAAPQLEPEPFEPRPFRRASLDPSDPPADEPREATFGSGRSYVQVGIFRDRSNAERLRRELATLGPVEVAPLQVGGGGEVYRVRVGPFSSDGAAAAQSQIATYGVADSAIVSD
jgi:rare lipoprotein A